MQKQIPEGNDRKKCKGKGNSKDNGKSNGKSRFPAGMMCCTCCGWHPK